MIGLYEFVLSDFFGFYFFFFCENRLKILHMNHITLEGILLVNIDVFNHMTSFDWVV